MSTPLIDNVSHPVLITEKVSIKNEFSIIEPKFIHVDNNVISGWPIIVIVTGIVSIGFNGSFVFKYKFVV